MSISIMFQPDISILIYLFDVLQLSIYFKFDLIYWNITAK